jgi:hypothetical protein
LLSWSISLTDHKSYLTLKLHAHYCFWHEAWSWWLPLSSKQQYQLPMKRKWPPLRSSKTLLKIGLRNSVHMSQFRPLYGLQEIHKYNILLLCYIFASCRTQYNSVFVFSLHAAFDCVFILKTLKVNF